MNPLLVIRKLLTKRLNLEQMIVVSLMSLSSKERESQKTVKYLKIFT